jgi:hypothetical protein
MKKVEEMLRNVSRGTGQFDGSAAGFRKTQAQNFMIAENDSAATYFPISQGSYAGMDIQVHNAEMRSKL